VKLASQLKEAIGAHEDFPQAGIVFRDVMPALLKPGLFKAMIQHMANTESVTTCEALIAIDARGFLFGSALSLLIEKPLITARKPGKLPGEVLEQSYSLEYGSNRLALQTASIHPFDRFALIDDLLATGGTARAVETMIESQGKRLTGLCVAIELPALCGRDTLNCDVHSLVSF
jgi:adenine phosphoribosyltransferase